MLQFRGGAGASLQHVYTATETCMFTATWLLYVAVPGRSWGLFTTLQHDSFMLHSFMLQFRVGVGASLLHVYTATATCSYTATRLLHVTILGLGRSRSLFTTCVYCNCNMYVYCNTTFSCCSSGEEPEPLDYSVRVANR